MVARGWNVYLMSMGLTAPCEAASPIAAPKSPKKAPLSATDVREPLPARYFQSTTVEPRKEKMSLGSDPRGACSLSSMAAGATKQAPLLWRPYGAKERSGRHADYLH